MPKKYEPATKTETEFFTKLVNEQDTVEYGIDGVAEAMSRGLVAKLLVSKEREGTAGFVSEANIKGIPVEFVTEDTEEGYQIKNTLGGIAAILKR